MHRFIRLSVLVVAIAIATLPMSTAQQSSLALTHATVIDVVAGRSRPDETVVITGDRIVAVGQSVRIPPDARQVDVIGKFIIPGFFDMHAHAALAGGTLDDESGRRLLDDELLRRVLEGVFGIRDMGAAFDAVPQLKRSLSPEGPPRPRVWLTGPPINGPVRAGFHISVNEPAEARQAVERLAAAGVDFIKVQDWLRADVYVDVTRAARSVGLPVVGHIPAGLTTEAVIDSGQRDIEHLGGTTHGILRSCSSAKVPSPESLRSGVDDDVAAYAAAMSEAYLAPLLDGFDPDRCGALVRRLARERVWQVPTLSWWQWVTDEPPAVWKGPIQRLFTTLLRIVGMMSAEGVPIMTGLDGALGKTIADEIQLLVRAGLSPTAALRAATIAPAEFLGVEDSLGAIAPGRMADLVILDSNPLDDVSATRRIHGVVSNGRLLIEGRPPVIDMHVHSAQMTPQAFAQLARLNVRYVFLAGVTADLRVWAALALVPTNAAHVFSPILALIGAPISVSLRSARPIVIL